MLPTSDQLLRIDPHIAPHVESIIAACGEFDIITPNRYEMYLAQIAEESDGFRFTAEVWGPTPQQSQYGKRADLGNTKPEAIAFAKAAGVEVGRFYAGHGFIDTTGYDNHLAYSLATYGDDRCARDPLLLTKPLDAARSSAWFFKKHGCNELADAGDDKAFLAVTRIVNGGLTGYKARALWWTKVKAAMAGQTAPRSGVQAAILH